MALSKHRETTTTRKRVSSEETLSTGIAPVDERLGGLHSGGSYLLAGVPGSGRSAFLLQFLASGLGEGRVGLVTAATPERVFDEARHWGIELEAAWHEGRFRLLSYKEDFQRRLLSAAEPREILEEVGELLGDGIGRLGIYPATPLWQTRAGTTLASNFINWLESFGATTLATIGGDLDGALSPASEWVAESVNGVLLLERRSNGLHQVSVRRMTPPRPDPGAITLALSPGRGFTAPTGVMGRRATDPAVGSERRVLMVRLASEVPGELQAWLDRWYETDSVDAPLSAVDRVQSEEFALILVYLSQATVKEGLEALNVLRGLTSAPILLATDDSVRASDRTRALEAGAADFVSGPLSVSELASRVEKAMISGASFRPRVSGDDRRKGRGAEGSGKGVPDAPRPFKAVVRERLESSRGSLFTFLHIPVSAPTTERLHLEEVLQQEIRGDAGDVMGEIEGGYGVVLAGTSTSQADAFLGRVRERLADTGAAVAPEILSGTLDADRIRELAGVEGR